MSIKCIILADVHHRWRQVDEILSWEKWDRVIMLGDYFDSIHLTTAQDYVDAATWLRGKLDDPRFICLMGNHDMRMVWPHNPWVRFDNGISHIYAARSILSDEDVAKLRPYHVESGILLSHAGFDAYLPAQLERAGCGVGGVMDLSGITKMIDDLWPQVCAKYGHPDSPSVHPLLEAGKCRNGFQEVGGLVWRDLSRHMPVPGLVQIVGHSFQSEGPLFRFINKGDAPMWRFYNRGKIKPEWFRNGCTLGLDTATKHYATLQDGVLTIKRVQWHRHKGDIHFGVSPTSSAEDCVIHLGEPTHA